MKINLIVEVVGYCPLRCVTCPTGRRELKPVTSTMTKEMLTRILERASSQATINRIALFNWNEPLMHPGLPDLVRLARRFGRVAVSTTGNFWKCDLKDLVEAEPDCLTVAISGWSQEVYETTHGGGDINKVREFMDEIKALNARNVYVTYHRYNNNLHEEAAARKHAEKMGFIFSPLWATQMPVEDIIAGRSNPFLVVPVTEQRSIALRLGKQRCGIQEHDIPVGIDGSVKVCTASAHQPPIGDIFRDRIEDLIQKRYTDKFCNECFDTGAQPCACSLSIDVDKACAKSVGDTPRYFVERFRKRFWKAKEF